MPFVFPAMLVRLTVSPDKDLNYTTLTFAAIRKSYKLSKKPTLTQGFPVNSTVFCFPLTWQRVPKMLGIDFSVAMYDNIEL
jgi:hypothetical protein